MAGFLLTVLCVLDVLVAVTVGVAYMDIQDVSVYGQKDLEYFSSSYAGFCTNAAFFAVLSMIGAGTTNHKFVATYKYASTFKIFATVGLMVAIATIEPICTQAKSVHWRWYEFAGRDCDSVILLLEGPLGFVFAVSLLAVAESSRLIARIKGDQMYRTPILIGDLRAEEEHPSLSPRGREIQKWIDANEPLDDLEGGAGGVHNPKTGFFYSGM